MLLVVDLSYQSFPATWDHRWQCSGSMAVLTDLLGDMSHIKVVHYGGNKVSAMIKYVVNSFLSLD